MIEVYPYAARIALGVGVEVKKKTLKGREVIQDGLLTLIGGLDEVTKENLLSDDELDAILSAHTAYLDWNGNAVKIDGVDGEIYLPLKKLNRKLNEYWSIFSSLKAWRRCGDAH